MAETSSTSAARRAKQRIGWKLMGLPWLSHRTFMRGMTRMNWHARLYRLGAKWANQ